MGEARRKRMLLRPFPPAVIEPPKPTERDEEIDRIHARNAERRRVRDLADAERDHRAQPARARSRLSALAQLALMGALTMPLPPLRELPDLEHE